MSNPAAVAVQVEDAGDGRWMSMHNRFKIEAKRMASKCQLLFIGDSIIHQMFDKEIWRTLFEPLGSLNFGIGGDSTQHVLWRVQNGELEHIDPKVVVLLVGTNNVAHTPSHTAANIVEGIESIVWYINGINSSIKILVLGLLPRGEFPNPLRTKIMDINSLLETSINIIPNATFLNADPGFVDGEGKISAKDMADYLHLTCSANEKVCTKIYEALIKLMKYT
ncbi:platelet-activating factor acetylhydrolase IB subunit gamma-like [Dendronephthya gigantea]|uniref:platelet-activating factor acetylhydrolase IB subunit gamma-like n=1 Tax=Dendronephthya gigantea TaxID=151771 RepID=UPI00106B654A|nr:platelet-activating factor acetylhydrolase IB subunit gamma-like [Dendronephthya gigantea]XP_028401666.1 platelet-activating factor acetylhydrolase IB subunit gamma-like [Dendronephthya gigantea]XP_028401667.1 platelet-activating factor acetylhydrolase IB subunit gamma-like [Dendronephthya gigantea]XP_028401668.1 platelet-activating factor acetylhydrolase IB subunit gamma-like [Dendronephthya gigantea]XP_028401669.1 platelet-activating factor acetylhydrolase IB subunit gamma-like [Dendroneph